MISCRRAAAVALSFVSLARSTTTAFAFTVPVPVSSKRHHCFGRRRERRPSAAAVLRRRDDVTTIRVCARSSRPSSFDEIAARGDVRELPVCVLLDSIRESVRDAPNLLLEAAPGAGKTTVVPLLVSSLDSTATDRVGDARVGRNNVIVVEPRRVAARSAAQRMAKLMNEAVGDSVGYAVRGESRRSSKTSVLVMTDGVLLNMLQKDPELNGHDAVVLDEFHERGIGSDTALALLREVQLNYRPDLRVIVMSATLLGSGSDEREEEEEESTGAKLRKTLGGEGSCNVLRSEGRQYPITVQHAQRTSPRHAALLRDTKLLVKTMADAIEEGLSKAPDKGDVLAFLPGAKEIKRVVNELESRGFEGVFPLYGALPKDEQDRAIFKDDSGRRKVIVSSPIAEASLTIEGVTCVVDSGLRREPRHDPNTGLPHLITVACSKDSAVQRAGRAGRTRDGYCIRLFSEAELDKMPGHSMPEIQSTDLAPTTLLLSEWGCTSAREILEELPFVDPPPEDALEKAYRMLVDLGALEVYKLPNDRRRRRYKVTSHGSDVARLATHPRFGTSIIKASEMGDASLAAAVTAAALIGEELVAGRESNLALGVRDVLKGGERSYNGKRLLIFASRVSTEARSAVSRALAGDLAPADVSDRAGAALLPGFLDLVAQRAGDASYGGSTYKLSLGRSARLDGGRDEGEYVVVADTSTGDDGKTRIRAYCEIDASVLRDVSSEREEVYTVPSKGYQVRKRRVRKVGSLVLSSTTLPSPSPDEITVALLDAIDSLGGVSALIPMQSNKDGVEIVELQRRIRLARSYCNEDDWPACFASLDAVQNGDCTDEDERILVDMLEPWLGAATSLKALDLSTILRSQLSTAQQNRIDDLFPTSIEAPDGSNVPIAYDSDAGPVASAKLQQFFGQRESPRVGPPGDTLPVSLSLLSPSGKPLARTIDLNFFWTETYPSVRAEMRGRYPKHPWPEDPTTATATKLTKKQLGQRNENGKELSKKRKKKR